MLNAHRAALAGAALIVLILPAASSLAAGRPVFRCQGEAGVIFSDLPRHAQGPADATSAYIEFAAPSAEERAMLAELARATARRRQAAARKRQRARERSLAAQTARREQCEHIRKRQRALADRRRQGYRASAEAALDAEARALRIAATRVCL